VTELQQNRYDQLLRRVGDLKGPGSKVNDALSELFPMIEVEDTVPELLALGGWRLAWQSTERPAAVAAVTAHQLFNPVDSGVIAAVTGISLQSDVNTRVQGGINQTPLGGTPIRGAFRDSRFGGDRLTTLTTEHIDNLAVGVAVGWHIHAQALETYLLRDDNGLVVLAPGSGLVFQSTSINVRLTLSWYWRERVAEASELDL